VVELPALRSWDRRDGDRVGADRLAEGTRGHTPRSPKARDRGHPHLGWQRSPGPGPPACRIDAHLGDLFTAQTENKVVGGREAVGRRIAAPFADGPLGHARAIGVIEIAGISSHAGDGSAGHGADTSLGVIEIPSSELY